MICNRQWTANLVTAGDARRAKVAKYAASYFIKKLIEYMILKQN